MSTTAYKGDKKQDEQQNKTLNSIIFCGGEKGGVGKSFFARCLLDYISKKGWSDSVNSIEADPTISDVSHIYQDSTKVLFSDSKFDWDNPNEIVNLVEKKSTIVNLPSGVSNQFDSWAKRIGLFTDDEIKAVYEEANYFFVSDGCFQSIMQFVYHVEKYKDTKLNTCLVLNPGRLSCGGDFAHLEKKPYLMKAIEENNIPVVAIPELPARLQYDCDELGLSYSDFLNRPGVNIVDKTPVRAFLRKIDEVVNKIFPNSISKAEGFKAIVEEQSAYLKEGKLKGGTRNIETRELILY